MLEHVNITIDLKRSKDAGKGQKWKDFASQSKRNAMHNSLKNEIILEMHFGAAKGPNPLFPMRFTWFVVIHVV